MKQKLLFILCFINMAFSFSQEIPLGTYQKYSKNKALFFEGDEFTFKKDNQFEYSFYTCDISNCRFGSGIYEIRKGKLFLDFEDKYVKTREKFSVSEVTESIVNKDSIELFFIVTDDKQPIPFVNINIENNGSFIKGGNTDLEGLFFLKVPRSKLKTIVTVSIIGCNTYKFELNSNESQKIEVTLDCMNGQPILNQILVFTVQKRKKNKFKIGDYYYELIDKNRD